MPTRSTPRAVWLRWAVAVHDAPAHSWRGLMIDSGRRFFPVPLVENLLETMAASKLNVRHRVPTAGPLAWTSLTHGGLGLRASAGLPRRSTRSSLRIKNARRLWWLATPLTRSSPRIETRARAGPPTVLGPAGLSRADCSVREAHRRAAGKKPVVCGERAWPSINRLSTAYQDAYQGAYRGEGVMPHPP